MYGCHSQLQNKYFSDRIQYCKNKEMFEQIFRRFNTTLKI